MKLTRKNVVQKVSLLTLICSFAAFGFAQTPVISNDNGRQIEFSGSLDTELVPDMRELYGILFKPVVNLSVFKFAEPIEKDASVTSGLIYDARKSGGKYEVLLIEPPKSAPYFCSDLNANGAIEKNECQSLTPAKDDARDFEQTLNLPISSALFKTLPIYLKFKRGYKDQNMQTGENLVMQSNSAFALGNVDVNNRKIRVEYEFDAINQTINPTQGFLGIDVDGDGRINTAPFSSEASYTYKGEAIFRLGDLYLSTASVDLSKNQILMRRREAKEYLRRELAVGTEMPDFSFVDFDNKNRSLADFKGKYLLVDFWGLWCVDCRHEIPFQMQAYKQFRSRGFEILGMNDDEDTEKTKAVLQKNNINWTQARLDSIKNLIEVSYRIQEYPSAILLGPDGKVLILDQEKLKGEKLSQTLDQILPH